VGEVTATFHPLSFPPSACPACRLIFGAAKEHLKKAVKNPLGFFLALPELDSLRCFRVSFLCDWMRSARQEVLGLGVPEWARVDAVGLPMVRWDRDEVNKSWGMLVEKGSLLNDFVVRSSPFPSSVSVALVSRSQNALVSASGGPVLHSAGDGCVLVLVRVCRTGCTGLRMQTTSRCWPASLATCSRLCRTFRSVGASAKRPWVVCRLTWLSLVLRLASLLQDDEMRKVLAGLHVRLQATEQQLVRASLYCLRAFCALGLGTIFMSGWRPLTLLAGC
jgi:hypothetical protein